MTIGVRRRPLRMAAIGLSVAVLGSLPGGGAVASTQAADVSMTYGCSSPDGPWQAGVRVEGTFPATGTPGEPLRPGRVTATVTLPRAAFAELTGLGATTVAGTARLTTAVAQHGTAAELGWPGLTTPATPVPGDGDLVLAASGSVPAVTAGAAGDVTVSAGELTLALSAYRADGTAAGPPRPAITCTPEPGQPTTLATIPVTAPGAPAPAVSGAPAPSGVPRPGAGGGPVAAAAPETPTECGRLPIPPDNPGKAGCAYMSGYANVSKLNGATALNDPAFRPPALTNVIVHPPNEDGHILVDFAFVQPLRARSTFLTFGFMPTTATLEMTQVGMGGFDLDIGDGVLKVGTDMSIRLHDVTVNGTPLDVGARCRTSRPAHIALRGGSDYKNPVLGGSLLGTIQIPPFQGCGVGEDLDPLFTAAVSGASNDIKMIQGRICSPPATNNCPPQLPALTR